MISYSQNLEDVILWRALSNVKNGFYVDVGANHPVNDSVTKCFYDAGWNGINIEPTEEYYTLLCNEREKDINLKQLVGDKNQSITFYNVSSTGLSTVVEEFARRHRESGWKVIEETVEMTTLSTIFGVFQKQPF